MSSLQHAPALEIIEILTDCYPRYSQRFRQVLDQNPSMLLCQREDMLATFFDEHLRATLELRRRHF
jgi:hypothetical protein